MTDKERLEEIEKNLDPLGYGMGGHLISLNDIYWLVKYAKEQAERVQELESNSYNAHLERLLDRREQQNKRYREALEFYANEDNWVYGKVQHILRGEKARKALEESK